MTKVEEIPIALEDIIKLDAESVRLSTTKFRDLVAYVDQLESTLSLCESDLERERYFAQCWLSAVRTAHDLLNHITNYYGDWARSRYHDLRAGTIEQLRSQLEEGNISDHQYQLVLEALRLESAQENGERQKAV